MRTIATQVSCLSLSFLLFSAPSLSSVLEKPVAQPQTPAPAAPAPPGSESGLISNFDDGTANAKFGAGWMVSTDTMAGGTSAAEMKVIEGGANKSKDSPSEGCGPKSTKRKSCDVSLGARCNQR